MVCGASADCFSRIIADRFSRHIAAHLGENAKAVDAQRTVGVKPTLVRNAVMLVVGVHIVVFLHILEVAAGKQVVIGIMQIEALAIV